MQWKGEFFIVSKYYSCHHAHYIIIRKEEDGGEGRASTSFVFCSSNKKLGFIPLVCITNGLHKLKVFLGNFYRFWFNCVCFPAVCMEAK